MQGTGRNSRAVGFGLECTYAVARPTCFTLPATYRPLSAASALVSFGSSEEQVDANDFVSLMASDKEEWVCSVEDPGSFP